MIIGVKISLAFSPSVLATYKQKGRQTHTHTHTQRDVISSTRTHLIYTHTHANCLLYISAHGVAKPGPRSITSTFADRVIRGRVVDIYLFLRRTTKTQQTHASTEFSQCFNHGPPRPLRVSATGIGPPSVPA